MSQVNELNWLKHKFILAFPGMGKTPLAKKNPKYADADFGIYREIMKCPKDKERKLLRPFAQFVCSLGNPCVLLNEPKLMDYLPIAAVYLPAAEGVPFCAKKMGVSSEQIITWIRDWLDMAREHRIPYIFLSVGLDKYLK